MTCKKLHKCNSSDDTILIPELEEAMATYRPLKEWTEQEKAAIKRYYGKVPVTKLAHSIQRTVNACHNMAERLGITKTRGSP